MKHNPTLVLLKAVILLQGASLLSAAPAAFVHKLWPSEPPGSLKSSTYTEEIVYADEARTKPRFSKVTDPTLEVFLPEASQATGAAVVICPGGGYARLAYDHEGQQVAQWFQSRGIAGIVLKYRLPSDEIMSSRREGPLQDVQEAIRTVRRKAGEWHLDSSKIGVMGFSAGGHLAGTATTLYSRPVYTPTDSVSARPDFSILIYGVLSMQSEITHKGSHDNLIGAGADKNTEDSFSNELQVDEKTPPCFLVHAADDRTVPIANSLRFHAAMLKHKVPGELHVYAKGGHGFGLGVLPQSPGQWPTALEAWLKSLGMLR